MQTLIKWQNIEKCVPFFNTCSLIIIYCSPLATFWCLKNRIFELFFWKIRCLSKKMYSISLHLNKEYRQIGYYSFNSGMCQKVVRFYFKTALTVKCTCKKSTFCTRETFFRYYRINWLSTKKVIQFVFICTKLTHKFSGCSDFHNCRFGWKGVLQVVPFNFH